AGHLIVTFAKQDAAKHDDVAGLGNGFVDSFSPAGAFEARLISQGALNSPWGLAVAAAGFGPLSNTLLVGDFGDGTIHGYDRAKLALPGTVMQDNAKPLEIPGLWALTFGNGAQGGSADILYFTAGIPGPRGQVEDHGLFGAIVPKGGEDEDENKDHD